MMKVMRRRAFLSLMAAGALGSQGLRVARAGEAAEKSPDELLLRELSGLGGPGAAGAVLVDGKVVARGAVGSHVLRGRTKVTTDSVFRIASITKVLTGAALLGLRDQGQLSLDDSLARFLPEAAQLRGPNGKPVEVTFKQLVTHTSGLPRSVPNDISQAGLLALLSRTQTLTIPGTHTAYSNFAAGLVGLVIGKLAGKPYRDHVSQSICAPLGMTGTAWSMVNVPPQQLATGHEWRSDHAGHGSLVPARAEWKMGAAEAFGGLYASVEDMLKLMAFELGAYGDAPESPVLSHRSIVQSHTRQTSGQPEAEQHGVFFWLGDDELVWHSGATDEYSSSFVLWPKKRAGAVILQNHADVNGVERATKRLLRGSLRALHA
jgi:CubicO group peptidase (beta-lactamase class C family)